MNLELDKVNSFKKQFKKRCFNFSLRVLEIAEILRKKQKNWILVDQLIRSATSIGANIVEGGNSTSRKEFINYFQIALKSTSETLYWLSLVKQTNIEYENKINILITECLEIKKIISTIILNTKSHFKL